MSKSLNMDGKWELYFARLCLLLFGLVLPIYSEYIEPSKFPYVDPIDRTSGDGKPWVSLEMTAMIRQRSEECFHQRVKKGFSFTINWRVLGGDVNRNFRFVVKNHVNAIQHITYTVLRDDYETKIEEDGVYTFCFGNEASKWNERKVSILVSLIDESRTMSYFKLEEDESESLKNISYSLTRVRYAIDATNRFQMSTRQGLRQDWEILNANQAYVVYWSVAQCCIIVTAAMVQVWSLRSLFNTSKLTPTERPRC